MPINSTNSIFMTAFYQISPCTILTIDVSSVPTPMSTPQDKLYAVASAQQGFFTTKQALFAGYAARTHVYHVGTGAWIREHRGIYRLARFPSSPEGQYVLWSLWSRNRHEQPQGVFSHQTALSIHEISDLNPPKLHMTVPVDFRRNSTLPAVLSLHWADLPDADIEQRQGFRLVHPLRAISDLLRDGSESHDHLRQALRQAMSRGLITRTGLQRHPDRPPFAPLRRPDGFPDCQGKNCIFHTSHRTNCAIELMN